MMRWLLTTRSGFCWLGLQAIATAAAQAYLHTTGSLQPVYLVVPAFLASLVARALWTNWKLRHRYCHNCGRRALECWPTCAGGVDSNDDGGTR